MRYYAIKFQLVPQTMLLSTYFLVIFACLNFSGSTTIEIYIRSEFLNSFEYCTCSADFECIYFLAAYSGACECQSYTEINKVLGNMESLNDAFNSVNLCCESSIELLESEIDSLLGEKSIKSIRNERCLVDIADDSANGKVVIRNLSKLSMKQNAAEFVWTNSLPNEWENTPVIIDLQIFTGVDEVSAFTIHLTQQTFLYVLK